MKKLGKKVITQANTLSAYCTSNCTCLPITCSCSSNSHNPTGNWAQGEVKAQTAGTISWL